MKPAIRASRACRIIALVLASLASATVTAQRPTAPPRDPGVRRTAAPATGVISGRVTSASDGIPVRGAQVVGMSSLGQERSAVTDDQGRFELAGLLGATWYLVTSKNGYLRQQYGERPPARSGTPIPLADGEQISIDIALRRASAIGGRVYDEYGEPLAGVRVNVLRARMVKQRRYLQQVGDGDLTDDTGAFRIHGLPPGDYYVSGSLRVGTIDSVVQTTYSPTYYPGTGSFAEARRVSLGPASEVQVDFPLAPYRSVRVSGTVLTSGGAAADAFLNLTSEAGELGVPLGFGGVTRTDGTFTLAEVPPGTYTLNVSLRGDDAGNEVAAVPLSLYGEDVGGVVAVTAPPATLRGSVIADARSARRAPLTVDLVARSARAGGEATFATAAGGEFELTAPPGPFHLGVEPPAGWAVKAIIVNEVDVTDAPLDLRGQRDAPARVVLTDRVTDVSGMVPVSADVPVSIVVFPEEPARWTPPSRYVQVVATDQRGAFRINALPGGTRYRALAVMMLEDGQGEDPEFLGRIKDLAVPFTLAEGEKLVLDLPVLREVTGQW